MSEFADFDAIVRGVGPKKDPELESAFRSLDTVNAVKEVMDAYRAAQAYLLGHGIAHRIIEAKRAPPLGDSTTIEARPFEELIPNDLDTSAIGGLIIQYKDILGAPYRIKEAVYWRLGDSLHLLPGQIYDIWDAFLINDQIAMIRDIALQNNVPLLPDYSAIDEQGLQAFG